MYFLLRNATFNIIKVGNKLFNHNQKYDYKQYFGLFNVFKILMFKLFNYSILEYRTWIVATIIFQINLSLSKIFENLPNEKQS